MKKYSNDRVIYKVQKCDPGRIHVNEERIHVRCIPQKEERIQVNVGHTHVNGKCIHVNGLDRTVYDEQRIAQISCWRKWFSRVAT